MFFHIEHLGIAVKDLEKSKQVFSDLLNVECYKEEYVESENVSTAFFKVGNNKIELLSSDSEDNVINTFISKKGEGFHHVAFAVKNLQEEIKRLKAKDMQFINETPKKGADNKKIVFLHPSSTNGMLVELCEDMG